MKENSDFGMSGVSPLKRDAVVNSMSDVMTVGQKLSAARCAAQETDMAVISSELCIRPHLLLALEQDDFNKFPSACYAAGFLKNYATYLGLNVSQITAQYQKEFHGSMEKVNLVFLEGEKNHSHHQPMMVSLIILSALVLYGVWYSSSDKPRFSLSALPDVSEVTSKILAFADGAELTPKVQTVAAAVVKPSGLTEKATMEKAPLEKTFGQQVAKEQVQGFTLVEQANATPGETRTMAAPLLADQVRLSVRQDAWIRIVGADNTILVDRVLLAGEEFYLAGHKGMTLMTSNAGAVSVFIGDVAIPYLGKLGEIRDNISLDKNDLLLTTS
ncbi:MAG: hypothetical protein COB54_04845 [Alphaproteobacteria bacterium]|nr:MAG: hypothetical protein COB54_04845 [Alphaproteobacteria bacterium]